jgi:hypothetical protein
MKHEQKTMVTLPNDDVTSSLKCPLAAKTYNQPSLANEKKFINNLNNLS